MADLYKLAVDFNQMKCYVGLWVNVACSLSACSSSRGQ